MPQPVLSREARGHLANTQPKLLHFSDGRWILSTSSFSSHITDPQNTIDVPEHIESYETLIFCGLTPRAAQIIWKTYQNKVKHLGENCADFADTIEEFIQSGSNVDADASQQGDDGWEGILVALGANDSVLERTRNLAPDTVMPGETAQDWLWTVVYERLDFLEFLDETILTRAGILRESDCDTCSLGVSPFFSTKRKRTAGVDAENPKRRR